ncbi:MAG: hypothetical protein CL678_05115 [Bdellovibrionaceae bacterium]|nr:hypothetical protein [Pseudobdellovibrionaceae bacterium]|tara:strand:+ start:988 stop:2424 length:1437 start_codon:yes stop_codon:yes gene_type:complete
MKFLFVLSLLFSQTEIYAKEPFDQEIWQRQWDLTIKEYERVLLLKESVPRLDGVTRKKNREYLKEYRNNDPSFGFWNFIYYLREVRFRNRILREQKKYNRKTVKKIDLELDEQTRVLWRKLETLKNKNPQWKKLSLGEVLAIYKKDELKRVEKHQRKSKERKTEFNQSCSIYYRMMSRARESRISWSEIEKEKVASIKNNLEKDVRFSLKKWLKQFKRREITVDDVLKSDLDKITQVHCNPDFVVFVNGEEISQNKEKSHLIHYLNEVGVPEELHDRYILKEETLSMFNVWSYYSEGYRYQQACFEQKDEWDRVVVRRVSLLNFSQEKNLVELCQDESFSKGDQNRFRNSDGNVEKDPDALILKACAQFDLSRENNEIKTHSLIESNIEVLDPINSKASVSLSEFYSQYPECRQWSPKEENSWVDELFAPVKIKDKMSGKSCDSNDWELEASAHCKVKGVYRTQSDLDLGLKVNRRKK